jgi:hypothetical protein
MSSNTAVDPSGIQPAIPAPEMLVRAWASRVGAAPNCERLAERNYVFRVRGLQQTYILKQAGKVNPQGDAPRKIAADIGVLFVHDFFARYASKKACIAKAGPWPG